jgi:serine/threonine protein kinase
MFVLLSDIKFCLDNLIKVLSKDSLVEVNLVEDKETKKKFVIKKIVTVFKNESTGVEERDIRIGVENKLTSPYLIKYISVGEEEIEKQRTISILMKYYERGSLADISTRARVSGKAFSQNV